MNKIATAKLKLSDYLVSNGIPCRPDYQNKLFLQKIGLFVGYKESNEHREFSLLNATRVIACLLSLSDKLDDFGVVTYVDFASSIFTNKIKPKKKKRSRNSNSNFKTKDFKWQELRYKALKLGNGACCLCGATAKDGAKLHVDHIKPKSIYPELSYELDNLQILCADCNIGKSNTDDTDWR